MQTMAELLAADLPEPDYGQPPVPTGLADLDQLTGGGLIPGALWVLTGLPGVGRTMLACQIARVAATDADARTRLVTPLVGLREVRAMLLAAQTHVPLHHLRTGRLTLEDTERLATGSADLVESSLTVEAISPDADVPDPDVVLKEAPARVLVIDDLDLWARDAVSGVLRRLRAYAIDNASSVVVTMPDDLVLDEGGHLRRDWSRVPRVVLHMSRPDLHTRQSGREGEIELTVVGRRLGGPSATVTAAFQGHYARFVDLGEAPPDPTA